MAVVDVVAVVAVVAVVVVVVSFGKIGLSDFLLLWDTKMSFV